MTYKQNSNVFLVKNPLFPSLKKDYALWCFVIPGIILTIIFSYIPIYGVQIAFRNFSPKLGFLKSHWVGLKYFVRFFNSPYAFQIIWNTFSLSIYSLIAGFPAPIILALLLNSFRHRNYRKWIQRVTYAPNFISTVVMCGMILLFLSPRIGIANKLLVFLGYDTINFMAQKDLWRHIYVWSGIWQTMGWSSVIYFAALSSVSPELYEAARIDGATKLQLVRYIDFPSILPTATILLILSCGSLLSVGFEKVFLLQNPLNLGVSRVISTYVYHVGLIQNDISYSSAIGLLNSLVNAVLLLMVNRISKKLSGTSLW